MNIKFDNTYSRLPNHFYEKVRLAPVSNPHLLYFNEKLADILGIQNIHKKIDLREIAKVFSGSKKLKSSEPLSLVYAGHQFGYFVPVLGDGRAILLGEVIDKKNHRCDLQLKGSGLTPFSRNGDGRAALGPMMREYIVSEAMHALKVKTTRSLALVSTGESICREDKLLPGAILCRVASSHIRIGTFEYFAARQDFDSLKILVDYTIQRHYPELASLNLEQRYITFLECVQKMQIELIVNWMRVGFVHGVMNTDNASVAGETIDYGPCAFIDDYIPYKVFSSIDRHGRYSFSNQASICHWNWLQLTKALAPLINQDCNKAMNKIFGQIPDFNLLYQEKYTKMMSHKLGIVHQQASDNILISELLNIMQDDKMDYTLTFRHLLNLFNSDDPGYKKFLILSNRFERWVVSWKARLQKESCSREDIYSMLLTSNPAIIPRNHKIEEVIEQAMKNQEFSKMHTLISVLSDPYSIKNEKDHLEFMRPPNENEQVKQTFCGT